MMMVEFYLPEDSMTSIPIQELHNNWDFFPYALQTQKIGDGFIKENSFLATKVPSAVVIGDFNFLINPRHLEIQKIKVLNTFPFRFDSRIFSKEG